MSKRQENWYNSLEANGYVAYPVESDGDDRLWFCHRKPIGAHERGDPCELPFYAVWENNDFRTTRIREEAYILWNHRKEEDDWDS